MSEPPGSGRDDVLAALQTGSSGVPERTEARRPGQVRSAEPAERVERAERAHTAAPQAEAPVRPDVSPAAAGIPRRRVVLRTRTEPVPDARPRRIARPPRQGPSPAVGLPSLVLFGVLALFVAWVSAEPFWIAVGHHDTGHVEVTRCTGDGEIGTRCVGSFSVQTREYTVDSAAVSGAPVTERRAGTTLPARMVSERGRTAYVGDLGGIHLRWLLGLGLLVAIGLGISAATGAWRFHGADRARAVLVSLLAPLLLVPVALALTY